MTIQSRLDNTNVTFILSGAPVMKEAETLKQDAGRSGALAKYTLMAYDSANAKWVPFTDETATDGTQIPKGISLASATEAEIKAGDIANFPVLVGRSITIDKDQLVIENSKTLATVVDVPANLKATVEELLRWTGIFCEKSVNIDELEN
jgi:hypothetical protein